MFDAVLIAGPTASGKSALAISVARRFGGVVLNSDSMQVYRDLRVITARPTIQEEQDAAHLLFGHVDGAVNYSAGIWAQHVSRALKQARAEGRLPIFAGGTGLYFRTLVEGLSEIPAVPEDIRSQVRAHAADLPIPVLHQRLSAIDPVMAGRLRVNDSQRILRALEVHAATGQSLAAFQGRRAPPLLDPARCLCVFLAPDRAALYERINQRFNAMIEAGALGEVGQLMQRGLDPALPVMRAHGVPGLIAHLRGEMPLAAAIERAKLDTRHYSKRQFTWFRHQLPGFEWVAPEDAEKVLTARLTTQATGP